MVPYHTYSPQAGFVAPYDYPYISGRGYGYGHRYGYGYRHGYAHPYYHRTGLRLPLASALCPCALATATVSASVRTPGRCGITNTIGQSVCEGPPARGPSFFQLAEICAAARLAM